MNIQPIAHFRSPLTTKFGIPRQSGIISSLRGTIVFDKEYQDPEAIRGLDGFDYIWIIWGFSENVDAKKHSTVRPPRLGGNVRQGVFATRSPFRENNSRQQRRPLPRGRGCRPDGRDSRLRHQAIPARVRQSSLSPGRLCDLPRMDTSRSSVFLFRRYKPADRSRPVCCHPTAVTRPSSSLPHVSRPHLRHALQ